MKQVIKDVWDKLTTDWERLEGEHLREMFANDPKRFERDIIDKCRGKMRKG